MLSGVGTTCSHHCQRGTTRGHPVPPRGHSTMGSRSSRTQTPRSVSSGANPLPHPGSAVPPLCPRSHRGRAAARGCCLPIASPSPGTTGRLSRALPDSAGRSLLPPYRRSRPHPAPLLLAPQPLTPRPPPRAPAAPGTASPKPGAWGHPGLGWAQAGTKDGAEGRGVRAGGDPCPGAADQSCPLLTGSFPSGSSARQGRRHQARVVLAPRPQAQLGPRCLDSGFVPMASPGCWPGVLAAPGWAPQQTTALRPHGATSQAQQHRHQHRHRQVQAAREALTPSIALSPHPRCGCRTDGSEPSTTL